MGDADEAGDAWDDELRQMTGPSVRTPQARAFTAAGLVLASFVNRGLWQYLLFFDEGNGYSA